MAVSGMGSKAYSQLTKTGTAPILPQNVARYVSSLKTCLYCIICTKGYVLQIGKYGILSGTLQASSILDRRYNESTASL